MSLADDIYGEQTQPLAVLYCDLRPAGDEGGPGGDDLTWWRHNSFRAAREMAASHGGHEETTGAGGWVATFESTVEALVCARELAFVVSLQPDGPSLSGGLSAGEVSRDSFGIGGSPVREAVGLCRRARPGQFLVANPMRVVVAKESSRSFDSAPAEVLSQMPVGDLGAARAGNGDVDDAPGAANFAPAGIGPAGIGPAGIGPAGIGPSGVGPAGVGPGSVVPADLAPARYARAGFGPADAGQAAFGYAGTHTTELHTTELHTTELHTTELHTAEFHPTELHPTELCTAESRPRNEARTTTETWSPERSLRLVREADWLSTRPAAVTPMPDGGAIAWPPPGPTARAAPVPIAPPRPAPAADALRLNVLGWVLVEHRDRTGCTVLRGSQARAVLSMLALRRGPVHKEELAEMLWPTGLPDHWEGALRGLVTKIRRFLEDGGLCGRQALVGEDGYYELRLPAGVTVDRHDASVLIARAEAALGEHRPDEASSLVREAVAILEGRLLSGQDNTWFDQIRAELTHDRLAALELWARADLETGSTENAKRAAAEALALDPYRESSYRLLMLAHAHAGSRGEALRTYEQCRRMLADELGVGPSAQTQALYIQLLG